MAETAQVEARMKLETLITSLEEGPLDEKSSNLLRDLFARLAAEVEDLRARTEVLERAVLRLTDGTVPTAGSGNLERPAPSGPTSTANRRLATPVDLTVSYVTSGVSEQPCACGEVRWRSRGGGPRLCLGCWNAIPLE